MLLFGVCFVLYFMKLSAGKGLLRPGFTRFLPSCSLFLAAGIIIK